MGVGMFCVNCFTFETNTLSDFHATNMSKFNLAFLMFIVLNFGVFASGPNPTNATTPSLLFVENAGQVLDQHGHSKPEIRFVAKQNGMKVFVHNQGIHYQFEKMDPQAFGAMEDRKNIADVSSREALPYETYRVDMQLIGSNLQADVVGELQQEYYENHYNVEGTPEGITGVRSYRRLVVHDVYPNIDWVLYPNAEGLKYDFIVHPGGNPNSIKIKYAGAVSTRLNAQGDLVLMTPFGEIREEAPQTFTPEDHVLIPSQFVLSGDTVQFEIGAYDPKKELQIDPTLIWATYYGGSQSERIERITSDSLGTTYSYGYSFSASGIAMGGYQNTLLGNVDVFIAKLNASGVREWATYYGGTSYEELGGIAWDPAGALYITGYTRSVNNIAFAGYQMTSGGALGGDAFIAKFNPMGQRIWASYYGTINVDYGSSCAIGNGGSVYMGGTTQSPSGIAYLGHQNTFVGNPNDAFLVKFSSSGARIWGTYCGGSGDDQGLDLTTDKFGNVFLGGLTYSPNVMGVGGHQTVLSGPADLFVTKYDSNGVRLWGTYYGGVNGENLGSIAADRFGNLYLCGGSSSTTGITQNGYQNTVSGAGDAFLAKFAPNGTRLWGTYWGDHPLVPEFALGLTVDRNDNPIIVGEVRGGNLVNYSLPSTTFGYSDVLFVKFSPLGAPIFSSTFGGNVADVGYAVTTDKFGNIYIGGVTSSDSAFAFNGHQMVLGANSFDGFIVKFADSCTSILSPPIAVCQNTTISLNGISSPVSGAAIASGSTTSCNGFLSMTASPSVVTCSDIGTQSVSVTVFQPSTGLSSTCNAMLTVQDVVPPSITCPSNVVDTAAVGQCSKQVTYPFPTTTDNCYVPVVTQIAGLPSGNNFPGGTTTNTFLATVSNGQTDTCSFTVTIQDLQAPTITCPSNMTLAATQLSCDRVVTFVNPIGQDNCPGAITTQIGGTGSGLTFSIGTTVNLFRVTDAQGNTASCSFEVTITDQQAPSVTCPANVLAGTNQGSCGGLVSYSSPLGTDNCPGAVVTRIGGNASGSYFALGTTTNTYMATDIGGNTGTCSFTVTVYDNSPPLITCPNNVTQTAAIRSCYGTATFNLPSASDFCSGTTFTQLAGSPSGSQFLAGVTQLVFQATDASGNTATCAFNVTITPNNFVSQSFTQCPGFSIPVGNNTYSTSGTYVDTLTAVAGCDSIVTTNLTISQGVDTGVTVAANSLTSQSMFAIYQWLDCNTMLPIPFATTQQFFPTYSGSFAVALSIGNCRDTSDCYPIVNVGAQEAHDQSINGYPNPTVSAYKILFDPAVLVAKIKVTDMTGKVLSQHQVGNCTEFHLDCSNLSKGMYLIEVTSEGNGSMDQSRKTLRFVKI